MYKVSETNICSTYILRIADLSCSSDSDKMSQKATSKKSKHLEGKVGGKKYTFLRCIFSRKTSYTYNWEYAYLLT